MISYSASPASLLRSLRAHGGLLLQLTRREISARYRGSALGMLWSLLTPLAMLAIYAFVFSFVFDARWDSPRPARGEFAVILFSGLILHTALAEMMSQSPGIILRQTNFVTKVVFPLEILPLCQLGGALFHLGVQFLVTWLAGRRT